MSPSACSIARSACGDLLGAAASVYSALHPCGHTTNAGGTALASRTRDLRVWFSRALARALAPKYHEQASRWTQCGHTPHAFGLTSAIAGRRPDYQSGCQARTQGSPPPQGAGSGWRLRLWPYLSTTRLQKLDHKYTYVLSFQRDSADGVFSGRWPSDPARFPYFLGRRRLSFTGLLRENLYSAIDFHLSGQNEKAILQPPPSRNPGENSPLLGRLRSGGQLNEKRAANGNGFRIFERCLCRISRRRTAASTQRQAGNQRQRDRGCLVHCRTTLLGVYLDRRVAQVP